MLQYVTKLNSSLTSHCNLSCDVPRWQTTNVPCVVSTAWLTSSTYCGSLTSHSSCLFVVLYWRTVGYLDDVTSRCRDVIDSDPTLNWVFIHLTYEWSSTDTRHVQYRSATYSWRSWRQTTMSHGSLIPVTLMSTSSRLSVSVLYRRIVEDHQQTTYRMLSRHVTARTPITYNMYTALYDTISDEYLCLWTENTGKYFTVFNDIYTEIKRVCVVIDMVIQRTAAFLNINCIIDQPTLNYYSNTDLLVQ